MMCIPSWNRFVISERGPALTTCHGWTDRRTIARLFHLSASHVRDLSVQCQSKRGKKQAYWTVWLWTQHLLCGGAELALCGIMGFVSKRKQRSLPGFDTGALKRQTQSQHSLQHSQPALPRLISDRSLEQTWTFPQIQEDKEKEEQQKNIKGLHILIGYFTGHNLYTMFW